MHLFWWNNYRFPKVPICRETHVVISREAEKYPLRMPPTFPHPGACGREVRVELTIISPVWSRFQRLRADMELGGSTMGQVNYTCSGQCYVAEPNYCLDDFFALRRVIMRVNLHGQVIRGWKGWRAPSRGSPWAEPWSENYVEWSMESEDWVRVPEWCTICMQSTFSSFGVWSSPWWNKLIHPELAETKSEME